MKLVSIIIPIYNVEKYLQKCLESVAKQTYRNVEIILVNDGSTDGSEYIAQRFMAKYSNIKYFKKENGGLSDARNFGVQQATGDYLCFVDSDDYVSESLLSDLQKYMEEDYDLIKYKLITIDKDYNRIENFPGPIFENKTGEEAFNILYSQDTMLQPACVYLYKKSFWDNNNFEYPVGKVHEDFARTMLIMLKANKVASTGIYGYFYYQSTTSITRRTNQQKNMQKALDMLDHYDYMIKEIEKYDISDLTKENLKIYYSNCLILKTVELKDDYRKAYVDALKKKKIFDNIKARNLKQLIKKLILKININWYLKLR